MLLLPKLNVYDILVEISMIIKIYLPNLLKLITPKGVILWGITMQVWIKFRGVRMVKCVFTAYATTKLVLFQV